MEGLEKEIWTLENCINNKTKQSKKKFRSDVEKAIYDLHIINKQQPDDETFKVVCAAINRLVNVRSKL